MLARPRSSSSRLTSRRITVTPRALSHCAMPEPITPAPITAACATFSNCAFDVPFLYFSARKKLRIKFWVDSVFPRSTIASSSSLSDSSIALAPPVVITPRAPARADLGSDGTGVFPFEREIFAGGRFPLPIKRRDPIKNALPFGDERAQFAGSRLLEQRLQIRARDEDRLFR